MAEEDHAAYSKNNQNHNHQSLLLTRKAQKGRSMKASITSLKKRNSFQRGTVAFKHP
jgi:hypothetical protein